MITKNQTKSLYYLDRDTDVRTLVDEMMRTKRAEAITFLERQKDRLQEKEAGEYYTVEDTTKLKDGELEKMMRFFRGAVVPYYVRQRHDLWDILQEPDASLVAECTNEIKRAVGFMRYDHTGHITKDVNSLATFERAKDFSQFLRDVEAVCFDDRGYIFPDSKLFRDLEKLKGREAAHRQALYELRERVKNLYKDRQIV